MGNHHPISMVEICETINQSTSWLNQPQNACRSRLGARDSHLWCAIRIYSFFAGGNWSSAREAANDLVIHQQNLKWCSNHKIGQIIFCSEIIAFSNSAMEIKGKVIRTYKNGDMNHQKQTSCSCSSLGNDIPALQKELNWNHQQAIMQAGRQKDNKWWWWWWWSSSSS